MARRFVVGVGGEVEVGVGAGLIGGGGGAWKRVVEEAVEREGDAPEGEQVGGVGLCEGAVLADCVAEEAAAVAA